MRGSVVAVLMCRFSEMQQIDTGQKSVHKQSESQDESGSVIYIPCSAIIRGANCEAGGPKEEAVLEEIHPPTPILQHWKEGEPDWRDVVALGGDEVGVGDC